MVLPGPDNGMGAASPFNLGASDEAVPRGPETEALARRNLAAYPPGTVDAAHKQGLKQSRHCSGAAGFLPASQEYTIVSAGHPERGMKLQDKVAIVTGAAHGIGLAIARRYVAEGAKVVIADIDAAAGAAAANALGPANCRFVAADVGKADDAENVVARACDAFDRLDILVNNAGIIHAADFLDLQEADFDRVLRVNLKGAFLTGQAAARRMVAHVKDGKAAGAIINMSSINAVVAIANQLPYCVSKGGLDQLTKVMALGLAPYGIRVNAIGPGSIMTDILKSVATDREARRRLLARTPLGRIGDPEEIAAIAVFLAGADASYVTGQTIYADGGRLGLNYTVPVNDEALG
jgi:NAD(P)-dependent dehydrogenase (short-subunit alcohol dehydrogenase family)